MSLQFILGKASTDHAGQVIQAMQTSAAQHPSDQYFQIVPNNVKFEAELGTLKRLNLEEQATYAQNQIQTFSFSRLIWYFLRDHPAYQVPQLSSVAINMIIFQIITDHEADLTIYRGEGKQAGFIQQVAEQLMELQQGNVSPDDLQQLQQTATGELRNKLHDLAIIYRAFLAATDGKYLYKAATLELLNEYLLRMPAQQLEQLHFYFTGFSELTAQELQLVHTLIRRAHVVVDLTLDQPVREVAPAPEAFFAQPGRLYYRLYQYAQAHSRILPDQYAPTRDLQPGLQQLEEYWISSSELDRQLPEAPRSNPAVHVLQAATPFDELMNVSTKIRQLVATGKYRYGDFLVVARNLSDYENIIDPIFSMQQIPYFTDIQKQMENHPLVVLLQALFAIYKPNRARNYRYEDVMKLLKTELLIPKQTEKLADFRWQLALCENLVLKNGYYGKKWTQQEDWKYTTVVDETTGVVVDKNQAFSKAINQIRHFVKDNLPPFYRRLTKAKTGREAAQILYQFLVNHGVPDRLQEWQQQATEAGNLQEAGQAEQVWNEFCHILDDYVNVLGDQEFVQDDFLALLQAGFVGATYSQIPSTLDQVTISEMGRYHLRDKRITIVVGADDHSLPVRIERQSLLSDGDRDQLSEQLAPDQFLATTSETKMVAEPYEDYLTFLTPQDQLYFSHHAGNGADDTLLKQSPYVQRIQEFFQLTPEVFHAQPDANELDVQPYLGSPRATLKYLIPAALASRKQQQKLNASWAAVRTTLEQDANPQLQRLTRNLMSSLDYRNEPTPLTNEIVTGLYGNQILTSISKLEEFYSNPYEYFLEYGLRLKERDEFEINPADTGTFYHEALDHLMKLVNQQQLELGDLDDQQVTELVTEVTTKLIEDDQAQRYEILQSSERMNYIKNQLIKTVTEMAQALRNQARHVHMRPRQTEVAFGPGKHYQELKFALDNHKQVSVQGRIDRIDGMDVDGTDYLNIVDYKSSEREIKFAQVYDGTAMQMMTYMDAVLQNLESIGDTEQARLIGALYLHVFDPVLDYTELKNWQDPQQIQQRLLQKHKYNGILLADKDVLQSLGDQDVSAVYPFRFKNDGDFYKDSKIISQADLNRVINHTEQLIQTAGNRIFAGDTRLWPARFQDKSNITNSAYQSVMQFDPLLAENNYREVENLSMAEVLEKLRAEQKGGNHE
ncbi:PD-(D/E)XK nuclease family protein [Fructilactobacillus carniphilus]|uniref:ATP-dependent helicase/deoxyribonuclease subunit B n=1 Tax=Fructilactobacillus carniphilus TaxID=2940297 RepID=A0ABY5BYM0_9LACO|nr:PD-(D/E)XK nuclease family protein [Fructilactobacillus carniphilus]USS90468.1 PD-(D/E)XK nuclease family protein [Fructilactobacillus carniphilus]